MVIDTCLKCGATGYKPSYQHPMQVVMQDEVAHICSACGYTWPREGRVQPYRERYGEPVGPYSESMKTSPELFNVTTVYPKPEEENPDDPIVGGMEIHGPDWCEHCQEDTPTIGYRQYKEQPERRCAMCARPKVLFPDP